MSKRKPQQHATNTEEPVVVQGLGKAEYIHYHSTAGEPGAESREARKLAERQWRILRRKIEKGRRVK